MPTGNLAVATESSLTPFSPDRIDGSFFNKHLLSVRQLSKGDLRPLFHRASRFRALRDNPHHELLTRCRGKLLANLFFEASTRTDLSFQAAMRRLGGEVIGTSNGVQFSSVYKGENLADTVRAAACYADVVVLRHPVAGSTFEAAAYLDALASKLGRKAVLISAGDGIGEHPTQALLDLYSIAELRGAPEDLMLDGLSLALVGDLKHGRTVHSLCSLIALAAPRQATINLVSPESLRLPAEILIELRRSGVTVEERTSIESLMPELDIVYWTRIQEERFASPAEYQEVKDRFIFTPHLLSRAKRTAAIFHPLPRKHEMGPQSDHDVFDADPRARYFHQMENGMYVRMAILDLLLNPSL